MYVKFMNPLEEFGVYLEKTASIADRLPSSGRDPFVSTVTKLREANPPQFLGTVRYAAMIGGGTGRAAEDIEVLLQPLAPLHEDLNGDGGQGWIPEVECRYENVSAEEAAAAYVSRLTTMLREDARRKCATLVQSHWLRPGDYCPDIVDARELRELLGKSYNAFSSERGGQMDHTRLSSFLLGAKYGDPMALRGSCPGDMIWIHGHGYNREARQFAEQVFAARELGVFLPPSTPEWRVRDGDWDEGQRHARAIRAAIEELGLLREAGFRYGIVWDQENDRRHVTDPSMVSAQLTGAGTEIFPLVRSNHSS